MDTKICRICERQLPETEFYKGLRQCKSCYKTKVKKYRSDNIEKVREYDRSRGNLKHRVDARKMYAKTPEGKAAHYKANKAYLSRDKRRMKCRNAISKALMRGKMVRQGCENCGHNIAEAHHDNYDKPLDVRWLCQPCHKQWHVNNKAL